MCLFSKDNLTAELFVKTRFRTQENYKTEIRPFLKTKNEILHSYYTFFFRKT